MPQVTPSPVWPMLRAALAVLAVEIAAGRAGSGGGASEASRRRAGQEQRAIAGTMYSKIYVPVDNSDFSNRAIANAVAVGKAFDSALVGCHVYAARMHDYRFKQMEYTLPDEYLDEVELERQRKIHDSLITMGLKLISESYLDQMQNLCQDERARRSSRG